MPDANGFLHLSDAPARIAVECSKCPRRGSYDRDRAVAQHGDVTLPTFLSILSADCPAHATAMNNRGCQACYAPEVMEGLWP